MKLLTNERQKLDGTRLQPPKPRETYKRFRPSKHRGLLGPNTTSEGVYVHLNRGSHPTQRASHLEGASKYSVPLMTTRCAGVLTPHARVLVATSTYWRADTSALGALQRTGRHSNDMMLTKRQQSKHDGACGARDASGSRKC